MNVDKLIARSKKLKSFIPSVRLWVTFQKNVCCHAFFSNPETGKQCGERHFSLTYKEFFKYLDEKNINTFTFQMVVSVLDQKSINKRIKKVESCGFEVKEQKRGEWSANR